MTLRSRRHEVVRAIIGCGVVALFGVSVVIAAAAEQGRPSGSTHQELQSQEPVDAAPVAVEAAAATADAFGVDQSLAPVAPRTSGKATSAASSASTQASVKEAEALVAQGESLLEQGVIDQAIEMLEQALTMHESSVAYRSLGLAYWAKSRQAGDEAGRDQAIEALTKAVQTEPSYSTANIDLGRLLMESGRREEGVPYIERGLALSPEHPRRDEALRLIGPSAASVVPSPVASASPVRETPSSDHSAFAVAEEAEADVEEIHGTVPAEERRAIEGRGRRSR